MKTLYLFGLIVMLTAMLVLWGVGVLVMTGVKEMGEGMERLIRWGM